jgi:acyl-CoA synthetase (AMP-forming)/AMP-acid ligase II
MSGPKEATWARSGSRARWPARSVQWGEIKKKGTNEVGARSGAERSLAAIWETIAEELPDAPAQVQGPRRFTWAQFDRRADGIARTLLDGPASRDDRVAQYLRNGPEYLEVSHAALKIGIPAVNTNYRYRGGELRYLWEDADVTAVVFHGSFTPVVETVRTRSSTPTASSSSWAGTRCASPRAGRRSSPRRSNWSCSTIRR